jgi:hypothetical protein
MRFRVCMPTRSLAVGTNHFVGTVPSALAAKFPVNSTVWASTCLVNATSRHAGCDLPERAALVDLYTSTNGNRWTTRTNWLSSGHPCTWFRIGCAVAGVGPVDSINTAGINLVGTLRDSLGSLQDLTYVVWRNCQCFRTVPIALAGSLALTYFSTDF